jgi:hypothetical protein
MMTEIGRTAAHDEAEHHLRIAVVYAGSRRHKINL